MNFSSSFTPSLCTLHFTARTLKLSPVQLSLREKQSLYQHLSQLLRAGITFPSAVEKLAATSNGSPRRFLRKLRELLGDGQTVAESFAVLRPAVGEMECTAISALERTGRIDRGLQQLSDYFGAMDMARKEMLRRSAYPIVLLHVGILAQSVIYAVQKLPESAAVSGVTVFLQHAGFSLFVLYGLIAILWLLIPMLTDAGARSPAMDWFLQRIFFVGKIRRAFSLARFCATYDMQLEAGVNVIDSLTAAGRASRSARIAKAVNATLVDVRQGGQVGPRLAETGVFPMSFTQTFLVAEETGELDQALARLSTEYQAEALTRLGTFSQWLPQILYFALLIYFGWTVISFYIGYFDNLKNMM